MLFCLFSTLSLCIFFETPVSMTYMKQLNSNLSIWHTAERIIRFDLEFIQIILYVWQKYTPSKKRFFFYIIPIYTDLVLKRYLSVNAFIVSPYPFIFQYQCNLYHCLLFRSTGKAEGTWVKFLVIAGRFILCIIYNNI